MNRIIPFIFCIALFSCTENKEYKNVKNNLAENGFKGHVKAVYTYSYDAGSMPGQITKGDLLTCDSEKFTTAGFSIEQVEYHGGVRLYSRHLRKYDSHNNVIEDNTYEMNLFDSTRPLNMFITKILTYNYNYDAAGNIIEKKVNTNGNPSSTVENKIDSAGNVTERKTFRHPDSSYTIEKLKYDRDGNIIESETYAPDGKLLHKYFKIYDNKGNLSQLLVYNNSGSLSWKDAFKYDARGNITGHNSIDDKGRVSFDWRYEYPHFDNKGNWVNEIFYDRGHALWIKERVIEYY